MSEPFLAEVCIVGFNFAPRGWAFCDGQLLPINQNQSLYSLLGTTYGGDGRTTFALPDLRGRTPIGFNDSHLLGQKGGQETHVLATGEIPSHTHKLKGSSANATTDGPDGNVLAVVAGINVYDNLSAPVAMEPGTVESTGANQAHENMQPFLALYFCIALQGLFPSRN